MKAVIRKIDRAIKRLHNIDFSYRAENFLISSASQDKAPSKGALIVQVQSDLSLGIYFNESVRKELERFSEWPQSNWSIEQRNAFSIAIEEVSHFHFLLYHVTKGRSVRQIELELQAEIDRFILNFFANPNLIFSDLFEQLFVNYRLHQDLSEEERERYEVASEFAKRFILKLGHYLEDPSSHEKALRLLRWFYRLNNSEKISFLSAA